jgi:hypothetical protein
MADRQDALARLRHDPLACLPALLALAMAAISLPARAHTQMLLLCSGGALPAPAPAPALWEGPAPIGAPGQPTTPNRDCDSACHVGCNRDKRNDVGRSDPGDRA